MNWKWPRKAHVPHNKGEIEMGEYAEMMLDGTCCACCGEYIGTDNGYATYCAGCAPDFEVAESLPSKFARCPECNKKVKAVGLDDHIRAKHTKATTTTKG